MIPRFCDTGRTALDVESAQDDHFPERSDTWPAPPAPPPVADGGMALDVPTAGRRQRASGDVEVRTCEGRGRQGRLYLTDHPVSGPSPSG